MEPELWPKTKEVSDEEVSFIATCMATEIISDSSGESGDKPVEEWKGIPNIHKYSSYHRLLRVTAAVKSAGRHWISKLRKEKFPFPPWEKTADGLIYNITPEDMEDAERRIIKCVQASSFYVLEKGKMKLAKIKNLNLVNGADGLLRIKGRISNANTGEGMKNPILLPSKHHVVDLIVFAEHRKNAHTGKATVFNNLRNKYWIIGGRNVVRRCFEKCYYCKISRAKPVVPEMGELPSYRLAANNPPFTCCGVDFFGPIEVTIGRRHEKRWVALFTCLVTRAVYLDIATGLGAEEMMMVLSRFIDTYTLPKYMYSDNATNFTAVSKELMKMEEVCGMKWRFIPPASPHFGGAWERMVGAVKKVLWNILKDRTPKEEVLRTALKAAENIVNSRPLTYVSTDVDDPEALTPKHFLRGVTDISSSSFMGEGIGEEAERMRSLHKKAQYYANLFWSRWTKEVLPDLVRRTKWYDSKEPIRVGDVVLLVDDQKPRNTWIKGVVSRTFPGKDKLVRVVEITTRYREGGVPVTYKRAVTKIAPIGIRVEDSAAFPTGSA